MKMKMVALSVMLLASVSTVALAQDRQRGGGGGGERAARSDFRVDRGPRSTMPAARQAPVAREAQAPRQAPVAPRASGERRFGGDRAERRGGGDQTPRAERNRGGDRQPGARPGGWTGAEDRGARPPTGRVDRGERGDRVDRGDRGDRGERGEGRRFDNREPGRDGRPDGWRGEDRRGDNRYDNRRDNRRDDRRWNGGGPRPDHPRWEQRRYPHMYQSRQRYRLGAYYPPAGFSLRMWSYGDYLPRAWYGESYRLMDWWVYDLPMPPPGFEWIRSGTDALLIDTFNGMVVQVVRYVFW